MKRRINWKLCRLVALNSDSSNKSAMSWKKNPNLKTYSQLTDELEKRGKE